MFSREIETDTAFLFVKILLKTTFQYQRCHECRNIFSKTYIYLCARKYKFIWLYIYAYFIWMYIFPWIYIVLFDENIYICICRIRNRSGIGFVRYRTRRSDIICQDFSATNMGALFFRNYYYVESIFLLLQKYGGFFWGIIIIRYGVFFLDIIFMCSRFFFFFTSMGAFFGGIIMCRQLFSYCTRLNGIIITCQLYFILKIFFSNESSTFQMKDRIHYSSYWKPILSCMWLRVTEANDVPVSSHVWVASTTFKQL